jgi:hypothetical protein
MYLTEQQREILERTNLPLLLLLEGESLNSDDEPDQSKENEDYKPGDEQPIQPGQTSADNSQPQDEQAPIPEQDMFSMEIDGTEDKFLQFVLYDKLGELSSKIDILRDNIKNDKAAEALKLVSNLDHYSQYLQVLNELIFSISTSVVYKILGQIELELIDMLQIYNASLEQKNKEK